MTFDLQKHLRVDDRIMESLKDSALEIANLILLVFPEGEVDFQNLQLGEPVIIGRKIANSKVISQGEWEQFVLETARMSNNYFLFADRTRFKNMKRLETACDELLQVVPSPLQSSSLAKQHPNSPMTYG